MEDESLNWIEEKVFNRENFQRIYWFWMFLTALALCREWIPALILVVQVISSAVFFIFACYGFSLMVKADWKRINKLIIGED